MDQEMMVDGCTILFVSGKRCTGKDYLATKLQEKFRFAVILQFAELLKRDFALAADLDYDKLVNDREYKEQHRTEMTKFFHQQIAANPHKYHEALCDEVPKHRFIIVSDFRFPEERDFVTAHVQQMQLRTRIVSVRVEADEHTKQSRGWTYNERIDTDVTETSLDNATFDFVIDNNIGSKGITNFVDTFAAVLA
eukprot:TRINITY_DN10772_c0_g1_i1.p1 TRINITY_DN10772_c0_g1~~TRINITY_DN10772_c0_g1_i1.p1  ORF type:complete len:194 (+),score=34.32 TRINITY_DN10772_c0_g1_i1:186-767(+)